MGVFNKALKEAAGMLGLNEKLNPAQPYLSSGGMQEEPSREQTWSYQQCYDKLEVVNRAVNMLVDDCAQIKHVVGDTATGITPFVRGVRKAQLTRILNREPNPFQDINSFKRALLLDFLIDGNMFIYWDGAHMYHLPATMVTVVADKNTFVSHYSFDGGSIKYLPSEIIHVKDNNYQTIYRGASRLKPALRTMTSILNMRKFQDNFFENGATPGLVLETEEKLNDRHKAKMLSEWMNKYRPTGGGKRPVILDGGLKVSRIVDINFKELDFENSITKSEEIVLKALGIPPLLLNSGNNANIRPNHRIYYLETILPIIEKFNSALERFFGFEIYEDLTYIHALRPELSDEAGYYTTLVNGGVMSAAEARDKLGLPRIEGHDDLRIPANIAGSAVDPSQGGRPPEDNNQ
jgi:HK97 family phage portal protein